jgi:hypothetical protein
MHVDANKRYDKRTIEQRIREGLISQKDYDNYLARLPDLSKKTEVPGQDDHLLKKRGRREGAKRSENKP